jgi:hypothetical protein
MRLSTLLLRLSLILALIANGTTSAFAATQMQAAHWVDKATEANAAQSVRTESAQPPCHEHVAAAGTSTADTEVAAADATHPAQGTEHGSPDCCQSATCQCACMHHVAATSASAHVLEASIDHASSARPLKMGHATPALPHLIRPPIG